MYIVEHKTKVYLLVLNNVMCVINMACMHMTFGFWSSLCLLNFLTLGKSISITFSTFLLNDSQPSLLHGGCFMVKTFEEGRNIKEKYKLLL